MSERLKRYRQTEVVRHLASQYVLGTLPPRVRRRVDKLKVTNLMLQQQISYWEARFGELDESATDMEPKGETWEAIANRLDFDAPRSTPSSAWQWWRQSWLSVCSVLLAVLFGFLWLNQPQDRGALSYVAVLTDAEQQAQMVASTYGEHRLLALEFIGMPEVRQSNSLELWARSRTDGQVRSLGVLPTDQAVYEHILSDAQWRLITDAESLMVTEEEQGGSPLGEPMGQLVSSGLCVRLSMWEDNS